MKRPIAIGLSPNIEKQDALLAVQLFWRVPFYTKGNASTLLENWFEKYFHVLSATTFSSGRGALYVILKSLGVKKGDEVILQAFTCSAVVQAIISTGATPIYADIDDTMTLDPVSVEKCITSQTKVLLVQHTFGIPADMERLVALANRNNIFLVEDVAHTIGGTYKGKKLGTFGSAALFSFGRDKAFSSVSGGVAITNDKVLGSKMKKFHQSKDYPSTWWIFQNLFHPLAFYFAILPLYTFLNVGKLILVVLQRLHMLSFPVDISQKELTPQDAKKMPPVLAQLALLQLSRIEKANEKRIRISKIYTNELSDFVCISGVTPPLLRYPLMIDDPKALTRFLRKKHIYIGDWYSHVIDPKGVNLSQLQYQQGSCRRAEEVAKHIVNLPTYQSLRDIDIYTIIRQVKAYDAHTRDNT